MKPGVTTFNRKSVNMRWKHPDSHSPKNSDLGKLILTTIFDMQGLLLLEFIDPDASINAQRYSQTLYTLHKAIKNKLQYMLSSYDIILHDNERSHVIKVCVEALTRKK
ncbi:hypothetical protein TNCV_4970971 [Trichonephila clavipes]|nr:hypothetical protein TNCV_4970971 [Trichonephila clavipes]